MRLSAAYLLLVGLVMPHLLVVLASPRQHQQGNSQAVQLISQALRGDLAGLRSGGRQAGLPLSRRGLAQSQSDDGPDCGTPVDDNPMWFTQAGCSLASMDNFAYMDDNTYRVANKGDLIKTACDDVYCPIPNVPDCYEDPGICKKGEMCLIDQHAKWGPWAMGAGGATPTPQDCGPDQVAAINELNVSVDQRAALNATLARSCTSNITYVPGMEVWKPIRGRCVAYRQADQSCQAEQLTFANPAFNSPFPRQSTAQVFSRPLVCDPEGGPNGTALTCTGPDYEPLPSTCVQVRPADTCFSGPWWFSLDCPRTTSSAPAAGLTHAQVRDVATTAMLLFPGEVGWPATCTFWDNSTAVGAATQAARKRLYAIVGALWNRKAAGPVPTLDELLEPLGLGPVLADPKGCYAAAQDENSTVAQALGALDLESSKPNKIWSLVHFLMHNQPNPMSAEAADASRAMASFLLDNFWCDDCRGFFYEGIVVPSGLPPQTNDPVAHQKWWWNAHNHASEHVASIRAGHPWVHQLGEADVAKFQNPFYMPWETAVAMWTVPYSNHTE